MLKRIKELDYDMLIRYLSVAVLAGIISFWLFFILLAFALMK